MKLLLVYCGYNYDPYSDSQVDDLVHKSGATDFLLVNVTPFNCAYKNDDGTYTTIMGSSDFYQGQYEVYMGTVNQSTYRQEARATITYANTYLQGTHATYKQFTYDCVALAKRIIARNSKAKIWFTLPPILDVAGYGNVYAAANKYTPFQKEYIINESKTLMGNLWSTNVQGFFYGTEGFSRYYTKFDFSQGASNGYGNAVFMNIRDLSYYIHDLGKKFLAIPYIPMLNGNTTSDISNKTQDDAVLEILINQSNYFDYALLQNGCTLNLKNNWKLTQAYNSAKDNVFYTYNGTETYLQYKKTSSTEVGVELEIDAKFRHGYTGSGSAAQFQKQYKISADKYGEFMTYNPKSMGFYTDSPQKFRDFVYTQKLLENETKTTDTKIVIDAKFDNEYDYVIVNDKDEYGETYNSHVKKISIENNSTTLEIEPFTENKKLRIYYRQDKTSSSPLLPPVSVFFNYGKYTNHTSI